MKRLPMQALVAAMAALVPASLAVRRHEVRQRERTKHDLERIEKARLKRERKAAQG